MNLQSFTLKKPRSVSGQIYQYLKKSIITCEIEPGSTVSEKAISSSLDVSRQPVREAFIKLSECGLLKIFPQRGTVVTKISVKSVLDGKFVRSAIECAVVKKLADNVTDTQLDKLSSVINEQKVALEQKDYSGFLHLDDSFHSMMAFFADCSLAWETIETIKPSMDRVRFLDIKRDNSMEENIAEHIEILDAIKENNAELAESLLAKHLGDFPYIIEELLLSKNDWFEEDEI